MKPRGLSSGSEMGAATAGAAELGATGASAEVGVGDGAGEPGVEADALGGGENEAGGAAAGAPGWASAEPAMSMSVAKNPEMVV